VDSYSPHDPAMRPYDFTMPAMCSNHLTYFAGKSIISTARRGLIEAKCLKMLVLCSQAALETSPACFVHFTLTHSKRLRNSGALREDVRFPP